MVIITKLKHNRHQDVNIPRPSQMVASFGLTRPGKSFSGEEFLDPSLTKIDQVKEVAKNAFNEE